MNKFRYGETGNVALQFTASTDISAVPQELHRIMSRFTVDKVKESTVAKIIANIPVTAEIKSYIRINSGEEFSADSDAFAIITKENNIEVYANSKAGIFNGMMLFVRLLDDEGCFSYSYIYDYPFSKTRGIKLLMPARDEISYFKDFIDAMTYYRHNTLMLEIGGAMEYKRHPEINEGWEEYAKSMSEYSGKSTEIQNKWRWRKNSIHSNNGGGSYLTQEEVKELIDYCTKRGITIIPEVPSTSHCDYLLTRHHELAERPEDPYPDTFCPSNPDSYKLLFDVLDEIIDVFNPKVINVGHDEYYSINICDRCRKTLKDNNEIFAEDLTKIHDYLASKNVKTMIWCDKLMNVITENGLNEGGAMNLVTKNWSANGEVYGIIRPTWKAREVIPKDIVCINWYWSFGQKYDSEVADFPVLFGNFRGMGMMNYRERCGNNTTGGFCSNWGATRAVYLQRNRIYICMAYNDMLYWDETYNDTDDDEFKNCLDWCFNTLFTYHYGIKSAFADKYIEITHTTNRCQWYKEFVDGIFTDGEVYREKYYLGYYDISYTDGTGFRKEVFLGENIACESLEWYGTLVEEGHTDGNPGTRNVRLDPRIGEVGYSTLPVRIDGKIFYKYLIKNPYPDKTISDIKFVLKKDANWKVTTL